MEAARLSSTWFGSELYFVLAVPLPFIIYQHFSEITWKRKELLLSTLES